MRFQRPASTDGECHRRQACRVSSGVRPRRIVKEASDEGIRPRSDRCVGGRLPLADVAPRLRQGAGRVNARLDAQLVSLAGTIVMPSPAVPLMATRYGRPSSSAAAAEMSVITPGQRSTPKEAR